MLGEARCEDVNRGKYSFLLHIEVKEQLVNRMTQWLAQVLKRRQTGIDTFHAVR